jgi:hypothetical protein
MTEEEEEVSSNPSRSVVKGSSEKKKATTKMTTQNQKNRTMALCVLLLLFLASMLVDTFSAIFLETRGGGIQEMTAVDDLKKNETAPSSSAAGTATATATATAGATADSRIPTTLFLHDIPPLTPDSRILLYRLHRNMQGFGSLTINAMFYGLYFEQAFNRTLVIDESNLKVYNWNKTTHMYRGYFEAQFPILPDDDDDDDDNSQLAWIPNAPSTCENLTVWKNVETDCQVLTAMLGAEHLDILMKGRAYFGDALYDSMVEYTCRQLPRLRPEAQDMVDELFLRQLPTRTFSVAFHVRRTDKIREDRYYAVSEYIETFLKANPSGAKEAQHCFVATDDYEVVDEMRLALAQRNIPCQLSTLTTNERTTSRRKRDDFLLFLAQLEMLIQAEYFVGTFSSNVGTTATLLRACPSWGRPGYISSQHYFQSFGVDNETIRIPK